MRISMLLLMIALLYFTSHAQQWTKEQYTKDFDYFLNTIKEDYCYWDKKQTDWEKVKAIYIPALDTITAKGGFVLLMEKLFYELYDHHASLNTNTAASQRLVPSGTDLWAEYINGKPVITEVRRDFGAYKAGLKAGMELHAFNDVPIEQAIQPFLGKSLKTVTPEAKSYALRVLLAGTHLGNRKVSVKDKGMLYDFYPDQPVNLLEEHRYEGNLAVRSYGDIGYLKINNSLGDNNVIVSFDSALNSLMHTRALIVDLRETPSGGNTTVARAILGRFITKEMFYQKHELTAEQRQYGVKRSWVEIVSPRAALYSKPLIVLVDHWTGSVGEGIAIGFDALQRATVMGTKMAGLNGANYSYTMPNTGIGFSFPVEKIFHVNGRPREDFLPKVLVKLSDNHATNDVILEMALQQLKKP
ncbi:S41 family peptidase [Chitinophagaceae bacterium LB-8]|uniref:S41 family peptidase n=1 Tax=Paraflavisolibacter caeni TaxID=2982496 RepID=A0A9X3BJX3_9BACT|nr:S41 family peptidase [Paraflavisolibacter caeni]MCU7551753.1 S41 family peptidase [Paraflavisolibacter caeni]